jgi:hypothetical protein
MERVKGERMMRPYSLLCAVAIVLAPAIGQAQMPAHLVLSRPQATSFQSPYSPRVKMLAQPYPYGYFGAGSTVHWQRQFGIHRTYTQWSQK